MGMFDSFYGKVKCKSCGKVHRIEAQTKVLRCLLDKYNPGDDVKLSKDDNVTKLIPTYYNCNRVPQMKLIDINAVVVSGKFMGFLYNEELQKGYNIFK